MAEFNKEDLLKVAKLSALDLSEKEIENFGEQLNKVLDFIEQIKQVYVQGEENMDFKKSAHGEPVEPFELIKNKNLFREDQVLESNAVEILNQAPQHQLNYFVVPKILNESKGS